jgi:mono/diheme cytochrome c family protein/peroxiredoxin
MDTLRTDLQPLPAEKANVAGAKLNAGQWCAVASTGMLVLGLSAAGGWQLRSRPSRPTTVTFNADLVDVPGDRAAAGLVDRGRLVYQVSCARCHGDEGRGDGPSSPELKPPPRDFQSGPLKFGSSSAAIRKVIVEGVAGTAMPSGQAFSSSEVDALVAFVLNLMPERGAAAELSPRDRALIRQAGFAPLDPPFEAPLLDFRDTEGNPMSLAGLRGKLVLLNFWGTSCEVCQLELPAFERLAGELSALGVKVLCLCADESDASKVARVARRHVRRLPVYVDPTGTATIRFDVQLMPTAFLVDTSGRVVGRAEGAREWSAPEFEALLTDYAAGSLPNTSRREPRRLSERP